MMSAREKSARPCWCGNGDLVPFSPEYAACERCGSLVSHYGLTAEEVRVRDDGRDYYGKAYWLEHMAELGLPPIDRRAVEDLPVRCLYWLRKLLSYRPPPARVLEVASAYGGFVAMLRAAGYDAAGVELSPWVVQFARQTFNVPVFLGPIEEQGLADGSFDVIVSHDLLEHVPDPVGVISHWARLLAPGGLMVIQTPRYPAGMSHEDMVQRREPFLETMAPKMAAEHLYLFSEPSVRRLLGRFGFESVRFELPAHVYDMYLFASREPLGGPRTAGEISAGLRATPSGRLVEAWLETARQLDECRDSDERRRGENQRLREEISDKNGELKQLWTELAQAAQTIADGGRDLHVARAELAEYRARVGGLDEVGPTAARLTRALTRFRRRFPALAGALKRLLRRETPAA